MVHKRAARTGDGGLRAAKDPLHHMNSVWGWGDPDLPEADRDVCIKMHPKTTEDTIKDQKEENQENEEGHVWGWGDSAQTDEERAACLTSHTKKE